MIILLSSLTISFFLVLAINRYRRKKSDESIKQGILLIIQNMQLHSSLNPDGISSEDHFHLGILIKSAGKLAEKTGRILIILLAKEMSNVYNSLKVKGR